MNIRAQRKSRQSGLAAVELAIMLPILVIILTSVVFYARLFMAYTVVQKTAQSTARYMASVKLEEIKSRELAIAASSAAMDMANVMMSEVKTNNTTDIEIHCDTLSCQGGNTPPQEIRVTVRFWMTDDIFNVVDTGDSGLEVKAQVTMKYAGY